MKPITQFLASAALTVGALELGLWLLPVSSGFASPPLTPKDPVVHYVPRTRYTSSSGWLMRDAVSGRMNSLGFSGPDVSPTGPNIALIGDSFVDALSIRPERRVGFLLGDSGVPEPILSLGVAGADFADYVVAARWAEQYCRARDIIVIVNEEDLSSSIKPKLRGYWYEGHGSGLEIRSRSPSEWRNSVARSRLASYLVYNLKFSPADVVRSLDPFPAGKKDAPPSAATDLKQRAVDRFVHDLTALRTNDAHVLLVLQPDAKAIYSGKKMARPNIDLLVRKARAEHLEILDLDAPFRQFFAKTGRRFDLSDTDPHWNEAGHQLAAQAIRQRIVSWRIAGLHYAEGKPVKAAVRG